MKRTRIRPISDKKRKELLLQEFVPNRTLKRQSARRKKQLLAENELKRKLYIKQDGKCKKCGRALELHWAGWSKHEIVSRARGGDPLDEKNCELLHNVCHMPEHGINVKEV